MKCASAFQKLSAARRRLSEMPRNRMDEVRITVGADQFTARWERDLSPGTCAAFKALLPFSQKIIHARWSGEACWIPLGAFDLGVDRESTTDRPRPGELLFFPA